MTDIDLNRLVELMTDILWMSVRSPSLRIFARPRYPWRELCPTLNADNSASMALYLFGWNYKFRGKKPPKPRMDLRAIQADLNELLAPEFYVSEVQDNDTFAKLTIWHT